jgi:hypothetical protein
MTTISFGGTSEVVDAMVFLGRIDWDWLAGSSPPGEGSAAGTACVSGPIVNP